MGIFDRFRRTPPDDLIAAEMKDLARRREEAQRKEGIYQQVQHSADLDAMNDPEKAGEDIRRRGIGSSIRRQKAVVDDEYVLGGFDFRIDDVFAISGRGTVVTGPVLEGVVRVGDDAELVRQGGERIPVKVIGIEAFRKKMERAGAGENVGLLLRGVARGQASPHDHITAESKK